jgi:hypothetical protein
LHRRRAHGVPARFESVAREAHRLTRPRRRDRGDRFVEAVVAVLEVDAEGPELPFQVARADSEVEPSTGEHVEARGRPRRQERIAVREHAEVGEHAETRRGRGGEGEPDERVEGLVAATREPVVVGKRMLGGVHAVEAGRLGRPGNRSDALGAHELRSEVDVVGRQGNIDLHAHILPRRTAALRSSGSATIAHRTARSSGDPRCVTKGERGSSQNARNEGDGRVDARAERTADASRGRRGAAARAPVDEILPANT